MACPACTPFLHGPTNTGPYFPEAVWEVLESTKGELWHPQAGGFEVMDSGRARCRKCGQLARFTCGFPEGYVLQRC